ncbi:MAG: MiaB/RimO family radical SAM methylthiotransferase [Candidatus Omnitrophica bacterium]|nr:MiaB/RimO family radical SAM methylthiotransferase [Candidatus Omnitrophota bacterium]
MSNGRFLVRVFLRTFGCQMNVRDSEVIAGLLKQAGYVIIDQESEADVVIFNTCAVRQHAEDKVWSEIGRIAKLYPRDPAARGRRIKAGSIPRPRKIVGLVGCMAQNYKDAAFDRSPAIDFVVGPSDIDKIPDIINRLIPTSPGSQSSGPLLFERKIWETDGDLRPEEIYHTGFYTDEKHAFVVISEGCSNYCSYCVVPYVRGELHHRNYQDILREVEEAVKRGIVNITLLGQNVNAYVSNTTKPQCPPAQEPKGNSVSVIRGVGDKERETEVRFVDLLKMVNEIAGVKEFSFITSHPRDTTEELFLAMRDFEKLKKYLHLPVQSGSDRILKLMNRGYTRNFYLELVKKYRTIVPGAVLTTDIIVGFPGETEKDFQDTLDLVKEVKFDSAYIFKYSPRPHSDAFSWVDDVPKEEKERRHALILDAQKKISLSKKKER